jgi:predicted DNA-binding transcriptional regulator AlpA
MLNVRSRQAALPPTLAPRLIGRDAAAAYVNVSPATFDKMVDQRTMPPARKVSGTRIAWDVRELDAAVDALPHRDATNNEGWDDAT